MTGTYEVQPVVIKARNRSVTIVVTEADGFVRTLDYVHHVSPASNEAAHSATTWVNRTVRALHRMGYVKAES